VARYTENVIVDKPFVDVWRAVHMALTIHRWNIVNVRDNTFFLKERMSFETMLWRNPCRFGVHVRREDDTRTLIMFIGSTLGFGPLPKRRLRQVTAGLKAQILGVIDQLPDAPPEPAAPPAAP